MAGKTMNIREQLRDEFHRRIKETNEKEVDRATRLKEHTKDVGIALLLRNGGGARDALEGALLLSSKLSFDYFLADCFKNIPDKSQDYANEVRALADFSSRPVSKVLLEHLPEKVPDMKASDLIESLIHARLYRAVAALEKCLEALPNYGKSSNGNSLPASTNTAPPVLACNDNVIKRKKSRGTILLSSARDGKDVATHLTVVLKKYNVVKLSQYSSFILQNPLKNLREILSKVDFVVPILTDRYIQMLMNRELPQDPTIEETFCPRLFQLLEDEWDSSNFRNRKVRGYKPKEVPSPKLFGPFKEYIDDVSLLRDKWLKPPKY